MRGFCAWCSVGCNEMGTFDLLVGLANDHGTMKDRSQDEQALIRIQHDWAEARVKGDSSFTRRLEAEDCSIVCPGGKIVNKRADLQTMTGNIVFSEFKINDVQVRVYGETGIVVGQGTISAQKGQQNLLAGQFVWTDAFVKQGGEWKVVASQITPVLER
jgi:ketosteroid isomerase-like protein